MNTPKKIYLYNNPRHGKKLFGFFMGALLLGLAGQIAIAFNYLSPVIGGLFSFPSAFFMAPILAHVEINQSGVFVENFLRRSLKWNEISDFQADHAHQKITVAGVKQGKTHPTSLVIKCPNGELDEVLALLSEKVPASVGVDYPIPPPTSRVPGSP